MSESFSIDETDRKIIEQLRKNGRATNQQIAEALDLIAPTVSARIRRMEEADMLRVIAVSDFAVHGYNVIIQMAIEIDGRPASQVVNELATFPEVFAAYLVTGRHDIDLIVVLREMEELAPLIVGKFSRVRGIRTMTPAIALEYQYGHTPVEYEGARVTKPDLDELDHQLIAILAEDARVSNRKIAADLGVNEGTIRGRIKRLQQDGMIAFTALTSPKMESATKVAFINIQADVDNVRAIARKIAELPMVNTVMIMLGRFNILTFCLFRDLDKLHALASDQILAVKGVHHIETSIAVRTVKYNPRVVRITETPKSDDA
ncbi:Lrp/AsnC family transcriptional regulator [Sphingobium sp.]|uniref:Lrp/AsnC family transcriptional regulator n=1 Tax=Sphingobium sp. TaxID=1912891 RepID=UPI0028BD972C|nr:Lrp/AsnC family transcriptional regulator [Sphingobium sp.]